MVFNITEKKKTQATTESGVGCYCHEPGYSFGERVEAFRTLGWKSHVQSLVGYSVGDL